MLTITIARIINNYLSDWCPLNDQFTVEIWNFFQGH